MSHAAQLWLFFGLVFAVVVLPGLDMAFVLSSALTGGRRYGFIAVAGIVAGAVVHVTVGALGIATLLLIWPTAFNALLLGGAAYVAWIGISLLRSQGSEATKAKAEADALTTFRRAVLTNLLNPKAYLFMLAVFPPFLAESHGSKWLQTLWLWLIIAATQVAVYGSIAWMADAAGSRLDARPATRKVLDRGVGGVLVAAALVTAWQGLRFA
jgi:threonine/homoserine/homoserine lactone efflux protein